MQLSQVSQVGCPGGSPGPPMAALPCGPVGPWPRRPPLSAPQCPAPTLHLPPPPGAPRGSQPCRLPLFLLCSHCPQPSTPWNLLPSMSPAPNSQPGSVGAPTPQPRLLLPVTQSPRVAVGAPCLESCLSVVHLDFQWPLLPPVTTPNPRGCRPAASSSLSSSPATPLHCPTEPWYFSPDDVVLC